MSSHPSSVQDCGCEDKRRKAGTIVMAASIVILMLGFACAFVRLSQPLPLAYDFAAYGLGMAGLAIAGLLRRDRQLAAMIAVLAILLTAAYFSVLL